MKSYLVVLVIAITVYWFKDSVTVYLFKEDVQSEIKDGLSKRTFFKLLILS